MLILNKLSDSLFRHQKKLEILAVFLFFCLVAFSFDNKKVSLVWGDYPFIALSLAFTTASISIVWLRIEKQKTSALIEHLQKSGENKSIQMESQLFDLSLRQKEVFDLILKGKSNKEITEELHIELSTLKTHINQIYKILGIKSRKETRVFRNSLNSAE